MAYSGLTSEYEYYRQRDLEALRRVQFQQERWYASVNDMSQLYREAQPMAPVEPVRVICPHSMPPKLVAYTQQLLEYFQQVFPEHILAPSKVVGKICCMVEHYKKLKTI